MLRLSLSFILALTAAIAVAQQTMPVSTYHAGGITEKYNVLITDKKIKQGPYQQVTRANTAVVSGNYDKNIRVGLWHFFDKDGKLTELYNYTTKQLTYDTPVDTSKYFIQYTFDKKPLATDSVTRPVRIGGVYYGYAPYIKLLRIDPGNYYVQAPIKADMEISVTAAGELQSCKLVIRFKSNDKIADNYVLDNAVLADYDKLFVPATINNIAVGSTIDIKMHINPDWSVSLY